VITITHIKICKRLAVVSVFILITLLLAGTVNAETIVAFAPSQLSVEENEEFTLDIMIESNVNVSGAEMELVYDPALMEVVSVAEGNFFKQGGENTIFSKGTIDNELGTVTNIYSVIMGDDMMLDRDVFTTITLQAKDNSGISELEMKNVVITNSAGDNLDATITNAEIAVGNVEINTHESNGETEEKSPATGQNSVVFAIVAMACVYVVRKVRN
jgi:hypothetical protein